MPASNHADDVALELVIIGLLESRKPSASICPSDAARQIAPTDWRPLMTDIRAAAGRLAGRGEVEITQAGRAVDPATASGPIRIRRSPRTEPPR
jgi:hypothetical protein